ncbi:hypothetical protein [Haloterrigena alkaliphila]|uniref:Uncharacterized protein n=1 Tax=Haloterrigena alkaliphila TaxID=2816475 RepID=A0A8A2VDU4_9EURY|nr:hypothetical protein [Haloterrigena alkaliphila]QSX00220.1 hypothetical protein J0X25_04440 [Haloterrigena alkaliphila]
MSPPPEAALALLGVQLLLMFWATASAGRAQARADDTLDPVVPDERIDALEESTDDAGGSFAPADD